MAVLWIGVLFVIIFHLALFWLLHRSLFRTVRDLAGPLPLIPTPPALAAHSTVIQPIEF